MSLITAFVKETIKVWSYLQNIEEISSNVKNRYSRFYTKLNLKTVKFSLFISKKAIFDNHFKVKTLS